MATAVDLVSRGYLTRDEAIAAVRRFADRMEVDSDGEKLTDADRRNAHTFLDRIVEYPVTEWRREYEFWTLSVQLDAPWVIWLDPMAVN
jgi:hypothetical protein